MRLTTQISDAITPWCSISINYKTFCNVSQIPLPQRISNNSKFPLSLLKYIWFPIFTSCLNMCLFHYILSLLSPKNVCFSVVYLTSEHWENEWTLEWWSRIKLILKTQFHHGYSFSTLFLTLYFLCVFCLCFLITVLLSSGQGILRWDSDSDVVCTY